MVPNRIRTHDSTITSQLPYPLHYGILHVEYYYMLICIRRGTAYLCTYMSCVWCMAYDIRFLVLWRRMFGFDIQCFGVWCDMWQTTCDIRCIVYMVMEGQHTCIRHMKDIRTLSFFSKKLEAFFRPHLGGSIRAFLSQIGSRDWIMYQGDLNCMLCKSSKTVLLFKLSPQPMKHIFKLYTLLIVTTYNWLRSSNLNLNCFF